MLSHGLVGPGRCAEAADKNLAWDTRTARSFQVGPNSLLLRDLPQGLDYPMGPATHACSTSTMSRAVGATGSGWRIVGFALCSAATARGAPTFRARYRYLRTASVRTPFRGPMKMDIYTIKLLI